MLPFELSHCGNSLVISGFQHNEDDAKSGNPYNTVFNIAVESEEFRGIGECEYDIKDFVEFAKQVNDLYEFKCSHVELREIGYGSHVTFDMDRTGHITICGEIFGRAMIHRVKFEFVADQTSLKPFADSLTQTFDILDNQLF